MAYIELQPLELINYEAKDIDVINFNSALQKIEAFVNQLNINLDSLGDVKEKFGTELPVGEDGDTFVLIE